MCCKAALACQSPSRHSRCRSVRPELTGIGAAGAQRGERRRCAESVGIVAGGDQELRADDGADTFECHETGVGCGGACGHPVFDLIDLCGQGAVVASQGAQRVHDVGVASVSLLIGARVR